MVSVHKLLVAEKVVIPASETRRESFLEDVGKIPDSRNDNKRLYEYLYTL